MPARAWRPILNPELVALTLLSVATHFWRLFSPNAVVFDEVHYLRHAGHYLQGTYYFDVHPPLGKLLYAAEARLFGVPMATLLAGEPAPLLRLLPAFCGALVVPLVYTILRQVGATRRIAAFGALAILLDNALLADSRFIFLEPLLIALGLVAVALFLSARSREGATRIAIIALAALFAGLAMSVKWTGASALGLIGATWALGVVRRRIVTRAVILEGIALVAIPIAVYCGVFGIHFGLLHHSGGDDPIMSQSFRETLIGNPAYRADAHVSFLAKMADVHHAIGVGNRSLEGVSHSAASPWYTWPIMKHPIGLWQNNALPRRSIDLLGNPVVWWGSAIAALLLVLSVARRRAVPERLRFGLAFVAGGFLINYLPFIAITRVMYLYHYLFGLVWLVMLASLWFDIWVDSSESDDVLIPSDRRSGFVYCSLAGLTLIGFIYFAPLTYGWPLSESAYDARFWVLHPVP